ncbi:MAG: methylhydantoinase [Acidobacteria bacterium]|nr:methylhydantoinase [Acidobacteriota bacterium]
MANVRVGVDVGGTFTKAVAVDGSGTAVATAIVPTTHEHPDGVAAGVVDVVAKLAAKVGAANIDLVTHSTTQAVNALLEGDVAVVGILGMATAPNVRKARKRTALDRIELTDGRALRTVHEFLDISPGLDANEVRSALQRLVGAGAQAVCVAEAFAPDDATNELAVAAMAAEMGLPVTTSAELTGLYGLELRTITAALNASILPIAMQTAELVRAGVSSVGVPGAVMVMRGDGGATDLSGFRRAPARTLYSGPAASVAGALRTGRIDDAVIIEVGGTSTNIAAIKAGRPVLSYVRVGRHSTAIRALDVRVAGVAGGSMLRVRRGQVYGVGPRSAHIAGLPYACFLSPRNFDGAEATTVSPRPNDPPDYMVLRLADGARVALTNTCAANALGVTQPGDYATGNGDAARAAFEIVGRSLRLAGDEIARRMLVATTQHLGDLVAEVASEHGIEHPTLVAVGGGAGGVGRALADAMHLECVIPPSAEIISSIGDALSLVRAEREKTFPKSPSPAELDALIAEVESDALAAGASPSSLDVAISQISERGAVRVVATGALALGSGVAPGRPPIDEQQAAGITELGGVGGGVRRVGSYWLAAEASASRVMAVDRFGDVVLDVRGDVVAMDNGDRASQLELAVTRRVRHLGPVTLSPVAWMLDGNRLTELGEVTGDDLARQVAGASPEAVVVIGRE